VAIASIVQLALGLGVAGVFTQCTCTTSTCGERFVCFVRCSSRLSSSYAPVHRNQKHMHSASLYPYQCGGNTPPTPAESSFHTFHGAPLPSRRAVPRRASLRRAAPLRSTPLHYASLHYAPLRFASLRSAHSFSMTMAEAAPPPLQIAATPFSPFLSACTRVTTILHPDDPMGCAGSARSSHLRL
jgi:hypothetical protein